ncbi:hypothetical protein [Arthrobacter sp. KNU40]|uniref:hypothetical protein n=1 Tax=Arthrobacter sp. KNU40 TaxID=3447965 RepID=UPI003F5E3080
MAVPEVEMDLEVRAYSGHFRQAESWSGAEALWAPGSVVAGTGKASIKPLGVRIANHIVPTGAAATALLLVGGLILGRARRFTGQRKQHHA